jgi:hypothetical protein
VDHASLVRFNRADGDLEAVQGRAGIAVGHARQPSDGSCVHLDLAGEAAALLDELQRPANESFDGLDLERLQHEDLAAREQGGVQLEGGVLGRRADERDGAVLDVRQERVLLRLVPAVDLVDEDDGMPAMHAQLDLGLLDGLLEVGDAGGRGRERDEPGLGGAGDDAGERRLADARRAPEDHRGHGIELQERPERRALGDQVLLAQKTVQGRRAHDFGQGGLG